MRAKLCLYICLYNEFNVFINISGAACARCSIWWWWCSLLLFTSIARAVCALCSLWWCWYSSLMFIRSRWENSAYPVCYSPEEKLYILLKIIKMRENVHTHSASHIYSYSLVRMKFELSSLENQQWHESYGHLSANIVSSKHTRHIYEQLQI